MKDLILVSKQRIGSEEVQSVNARQLHGYLGSRQDFSTWIKSRIEQYGFVESTDYLIHKFMDNPAGGRPTVDYHLTLSTAKELAMVERNDQGKKARQYFIECERQLKDSESAVAMLNNPAAMRDLLLGYSNKLIEQDKTIKSQEKAIEKAQPAIQFVERYVETNGTKSFREVCKLLRANENRFRDFLIESGVFYILNARPTPRAEHINAGRFEIKIGVSSENNHAYNQARFTAKGVNWIAAKWAVHNVNQAQVVV